MVFFSWMTRDSLGQLITPTQIQDCQILTEINRSYLQQSVKNLKRVPGQMRSLTRWRLPQVFGDNFAVRKYLLLPTSSTTTLTFCTRSWPPCPSERTIAASKTTTTMRLPRLCRRKLLNSSSLFLLWPFLPRRLHALRWSLPYMPARYLGRCSKTRQHLWERRGNDDGEDVNDDNEGKLDEAQAQQENINWKHK